jgi:cell division protein ZapA
MAITKQVEVQIMGQSYLLGCPEGGEQRLLEAVERVDTAMCRIRDAGKVKARDRIAVLAALNLAVDVSDRRASPELQAAGFAGSEPTLNGTLNGNGHSVKDDAKLAAMLVKLDRALGEDGRLL